MYLIEVGLAGNAQGAYFSSTSKKYRRAVCFG